MNNEDPDFIFGCGQSCVFRFPKIGGIGMNRGCDCIPSGLTPSERVELHKKIRDLVSYASGLRLEHKQNQKKIPVAEKRDPYEMILGC